MCELCREGGGAGDTALEAWVWYGCGWCEWVRAWEPWRLTFALAGDVAGRFVAGRGDTARRFEGARDAGAGDALSRLSVESRFMDEKGFVVFAACGVAPARSRSRAAAAGFGAPAAA